METKFTKGEWKVENSPQYHEPKSSTIEIHSKRSQGWIAKIQNNGIIRHKEGLANAKLISFAPEMFYRTVLLANSEGWQDAFDLICKITGKEYKYLSDDFNQLVEEARSFFQH